MIRSPLTPISSNPFTMPNEEALQAALHDYLHGPQAQGSIRRAAFVYGVPASTLRDRIHGKSPIQESHQASQLLSPTQILIVKEMIRKKDAWGFSVDHSYVREVVQSVTGEEPGKNWVTRFIARERDLESIFHKPRNKERQFSTSYASFESFFTLVCINIFIT